jgi:hypothetical protein
MKKIDLVQDTIDNKDIDNMLQWGTPNDYLTYTYWGDFFDKYTWYPYKK